MRPAFNLVAQYVSQIWPTVLPITFFFAGTLTGLATPLRHSLFCTGIAWFICAVLFGWKARTSAGNGSARRWKLSWLAGLLYALAQICERATVDRENYWWTKVRIASDTRFKGGL
jgi:hypothetical protein